MRGPVTTVVPADASGTRLDRYLAAVPGLGTRSHVKRWIGEGRVVVDGVVRKAAFVVAAGSQVTVDVPAPDPIIAEPEAIALVVLYEDDDLIALDKPPGLVVHPAPGARRGTLVNALLHRWGPLAGVGEADRPGIVHRLDRDTSGVLLVARTVEALEALARQFRERTTEKHYLTVVRGAVRQEQGTIDRPIGRHPTERKRMSVHSARGRRAVTHWAVRERLPGATVLNVRIETGRTHQIRVHLAALGYPVIGDKVYGGGSKGGLTFERQALHAASIRFRHPRTGAPMHVAAPLPPDLVALVDRLRHAPA